MNRIIAEIERLRELAETIPTADTTKEFISGGMKECRFEKIMDKVMELEDELKALEEEIERIENACAKEIMKDRLHGMSVKKIAAKYGCSTSKIYKILTKYHK